jgi:hypothetical protein
MIPLEAITRRGLTATVGVAVVAVTVRGAVVERRQVLGMAATGTGTDMSATRAVLCLPPMVATAGEVKEAVLIMVMFQTMECAWAVAAAVAAIIHIKSLREREWSYSHCEFLPLVAHWVLLGADLADLEEEVVVVVAPLD